MDDQPDALPPDAAGYLPASDSRRVIEVVGKVALARTRYPRCSDFYGGMPTGPWTEAALQTILEFFDAGRVPPGSEQQVASLAGRLDRHLDDSRKAAAAPRVSPAVAGRLERESKQMGSEAVNLVGLWAYQIDPAHLAEWAEDPEHTIRLAVANNPNTAAETLAGFEGDPDQKVREAVANNPNTAAETLTALAADPDEFVRAAAAGNPNTAIETLTALAADPGNVESSEVSETLAGNALTPPEVLTRLASHPSDTVRETVAGNALTPPEVLTRLASDPGVWVRSAAAINPSLPPAGRATSGLFAAT